MALRRYGIYVQKYETCDAQKFTRKLTHCKAFVFSIVLLFLFQFGVLVWHRTSYSWYTLHTSNDNNIWNAPKSYKSFVFLCQVIWCRCRFWFQFQLLFCSLDVPLTVPIPIPLTFIQAMDLFCSFIYLVIFVSSSTTFASSLQFYYYYYDCIFRFQSVQAHGFSVRRLEYIWHTNVYSFDSRFISLLFHFFSFSLLSHFICHMLQKNGQIARIRSPLI